MIDIDFHIYSFYDLFINCLEPRNASSLVSQGTVILPRNLILTKKTNRFFGNQQSFKNGVENLGR